MKKLACLLAVACLLAGCGGNSGDDKDNKDNKDNNAAEKTGEGTATNESNGETLTTTAHVTVDADGKITAVDFDETYTKDGKETTKKTLKDDYTMKGASAIGKEWWEQAEFLENYVKENGLDGIEMDEEGKPTNEDILTGCTMNIKPYVEAMKAAKDNAK